MEVTTSVSFLSMLQTPFSMRLKNPLVGMAVSAALLSSASAVTLASYAFGTDLNVTSTAGNVTASAITGATGRSANSYAYRFTTAPAPYQMQFSVTAAGGFVLDLSTISFRYDFLQSGGTVVNWNSTFDLYYSTDGFATAGTLVQQFADTSGTALTSGGPAFNNSGNLDLSALGDVNSISFRFVFANNSSPVLDTNTYRYAIDDIVVSGEVVSVPELSGSLMVAAGAGMISLRRRRQPR